MTTTLDFRIISGKLAKIGESPVWSQAENVLYWIDCDAPALHRLDLVTSQEQSWTMPCRIGGVVPSATGPVVILKTGIYALDTATGELDIIAETPLRPGNVALHEARCDPSGRLWVGVINLDYIHFQSRGGSALFRLVGGAFDRCLEARAGTVSNGLAWSPDGSVMYLADSPERTIYAFDFDPATGAASNRRVFHYLPAGIGIPDGAAVDVEGGYWFACPGGGRVRRLNPDGSLDREIATPCDYPTKVGFAGPGMEQMIVSSLSMRGAKPGKEDLEGRLFAIPAPIPGVPEPLFDPTR